MFPGSPDSRLIYGYSNNNSILRANLQMRKSIAWSCGIRLFDVTQFHLYRRVMPAPPKA